MTMSDNELLLAISSIVQSQVEPMKNDLRDIKLILENDILPRLQNIESCYTTTYKRYQSGTNQIDTIAQDVDILKKVVREHSEKLDKVS